MQIALATKQQSLATQSVNERMKRISLELDDTQSQMEKLRELGTELSTISSAAKSVTASYKLKIEQEEVTSIGSGFENQYDKKRINY